jgi:hypothetical protein
MQDLEERVSLDMAAAAAAVKHVKVLTIHGTGEQLATCDSDPALPCLKALLGAFECLCGVVLCLFGLCLLRLTSQPGHGGALGSTICRCHAQRQARSDHGVLLSAGKPKASTSCYGNIQCVTQSDADALMLSLLQTSQKHFRVLKPQS